MFLKLVVVLDGSINSTLAAKCPFEEEYYGVLPGGIRDNRGLITPGEVLFSWQFPK